jgi:hypothetical protein
MNFAQLTPIAKSHIRVPYFNATGLVTGLVLLIVFAIAIYLASKSPGVTLEDFAAMTAFP